MKNPLSKFVIVVTGDFGEARTHDTSVTSETTHLVASEQHWKKNSKLGEFECSSRAPNHATNSHCTKY